MPGGGGQPGGGKDNTVEVSGVKFEDLNANGKQDYGEKGLKNWTIEAFVDKNGDGKLDQNEFKKGPADTDVTNYNGEYDLKLKKGYDYIIVEQLKDKWYQSAPDTKVLARSLDTGKVSLGQYGYSINNLKRDVKGEDFGNYQNGTLSGTKFNDKDHDGKQDYGETGLKDWKIEAFVDKDGDGKLDQNEFKKGPADTDYTDYKGNYSLHVTPGYKYIIVEVQQKGWKQSKVDDQKDVHADDSLGQYGYVVKNVKSGGKVDDLDFGNFQKKNRGDKGYDPGYDA